MTRPNVVVIGGPNGAGKTTTAVRLLPALGIVHFVNADDVARGLSAFAPETVSVAAGRIMLERIRELAQRRESFAFETTLAPRSFAVLLRELSAVGYDVQLVYLWLRDPEIAVSRVEERVRRGGHHVPADIVRRRYWGGLRHFFQLYRPLADSWQLYDNSERQAGLIAYCQRGGTDVILLRDVWQRLESEATR